MKTKVSEWIKEIHRVEKGVFFNMYKMSLILKETWKKCGIRAVIFNNRTKIKKELWLKMQHI